ncbi:MAG: hypothetical protein C0518_11770 [Opitutus sp.]|nr:hypothetical protein [Opitutus sp.]
MVLLCSGCTSSLTIVSGRIAVVDEQAVTVELKTKEDLKKYRRSFWAVTVYLAYQPHEVEATPALPGYKPEAREFVFRVQPQEHMEPASDGAYMTTWRIPRTSRFAWASTEYSYHVQPGEEIRLRLGGGTMHGTSVESNELRLRVPIQAAETTRGK